MSFTTDWFTHNITAIVGTLEKCVIPENPNMLEIGSWEGLSTTWFLRSLPSASITCIDTFEGGAEHQAMPQLIGVEQRFLQNIEPYKERVRVLKGKSHVMLFHATPVCSYDIIYVDASHASWDALTDIVMSFQLLKVGGIMMIDDYGGGLHSNNIYATSPKPAVDAFLEIMAPFVEVIHKNYQVHIRKIA
jgi:predicted O-methyltransferase YrrM